MLILDSLNHEIQDSWDSIFTALKMKEKGKKIMHEPNIKPKLNI